MLFRSFRDLAAELGIKPRQVPLILLFHAQPGVFQRGFLVNKYKLNKMLFYQWKMLEKMGLGEGFIHDEFIPEKNGPVPKSLFEDLDDLRDKGLIKLSGGKKERKPVEAVLTLEGEHLATKTWCSVAEPYREISTDVKNMIFPLDPKTVKEKVHAEYPEFRKVYVEEDHE